MNEARRTGVESAMNKWSADMRAIAGRIDMALESDELMIEFADDIGRILKVLDAISTDMAQQVARIRREYSPGE